jgi:hypothetical protein
MHRIPVARTPSGSLFIIERGDTLSKLINEVHRMSIRDHSPFVDMALLDNPHIKDPDLIYPDDAVFIRKGIASGGSMAAGPSPDEIAAAAQEIKAMDDTTRSIVHQVAPYAAATTKGAAGGISAYLESSARYIADDLQGLLDARTSGTITTAQLVKRHAGTTTFQDPGVRRTILGSWNQVKISARRGKSANAQVLSQVHRAKGWAKAAKRAGSVVAITVDAGIVCYDIAHARDIGERNGRFVKGVVGAGVGMAAGAGITAVALAVLSGPPGWVVGLVAVVGGVAGGYVGGAAGLGAERLYDAHGQGYDVVGTLGVDRVCSAEVLPFAAD